MQLRQLRKAWVGDWEPDGSEVFSALDCVISSSDIKVGVSLSGYRYISKP